MISNNSIPLDSSIPLQIGLQWDMLNQQKIDLDASCVLLDYMAEISDVVYYNQLNSKCNSIRHTGDQQRGDKQGYDEEIFINLNQLSLDIKCLALIISAYNGEGFTKVESSSSQLMQNGQVISSIPVGAMGNFNSVLVCFIYRDEIHRENWKFVSVQDSGNGKNFMENEQLIKSNLNKFNVIDEGLISEGKKWVVGSGKSFNLKKGQMLQLPQNLNQICVGLGWDTYLDLDSSIIQIDNKFNLQEKVSFSHLRNANESIIHMGDNTTGQGSGDDETIKIFLDKLPQDCHQIWVAINVFTYGKQFDDVKGAYCRIYDQQSKSEFCRVNLSRQLDNISNGCIVANLQRYQQNNWIFEFREYWTKNTKTADDITNIIKEVNNQDLSRVKIIDENGNIVKGFRDGQNGDYNSRSQHNARRQKQSSNAQDGCCTLF